MERDLPDIIDSSAVRTELEAVIRSAKTTWRTPAELGGVELVEVADAD
jgi:hypothetical protein